MGFVNLERTLPFEFVICDGIGMIFSAFFQKRQKKKKKIKLELS